MSDYNDGLLPEPCLRMDTHFGDEYESVEFGDGTGYVKAVPTLARLGALHVELDELRDENAKLREQVARLFDKTLELGTENAKLRELVKSMYYDLTHMTFPPDWVTDYEADMRELGVEVD